MSEGFHNFELQITAAASLLLTLACTVGTIAWILMTKKESTSAVAWCLLVFFVPLLGSVAFVLFGYSHVHRPLKRKRKRKQLFGLAHAGAPSSMPFPDAPAPLETPWTNITRLAQRLGAFPRSDGNDITFYYEGATAYEAMLNAMRSAQHHIHLQTFILQPQGIGRQVMDLLAEKARAGVEVRLLYDAMGSRHVHSWTLKALRAAGVRCAAFLPVNPFRRRIQVNMRNHRKILVADGNVAFTGGLNIGDEYLGKVRRYGLWRDTHLCARGPAVAGLQRVFLEDWDFAAEEDVQGAAYYPELSSPGAISVQVIHSGPDQDRNSIREIYFAAILQARQRLWIASPYFIPDGGLQDALCLAAFLGVDVRILCLHHPDKWVPFFAGRFYWGDALAAGVKIYQYTRGMMHSKVILVDGAWASVGTANLDNRSLHLNFEVNCLIDSPPAVAELERAFQEDLHTSICLNREVFLRRPLPGRILDNACRLLSPIL
jgi:cardiolipin synthase